MATGETSEVDAKWTSALATDGERFYGASCYEIWSMPIAGGPPTVQELPLGVGCPVTMAHSAGTLYFDGGVGLHRASTSLEDITLLAVPSDVGRLVAFVARDDELFAHADGSIIQFDAAGQQVLTEATSVTGLAVDGDTLYWISGDIGGDQMLDALAL